MARPPPKPRSLPPATAGQVWWDFLKWAVGLPLAVAAALGIVWIALWATGSYGMMPKAENDMLGVLGWIALIVLLYPVTLVFMILDLRDGLKAAREWEAMTPEARAAALAEAAAAATRPKKG